MSASFRRVAALLLSLATGWGCSKNAAQIGDKGPDSGSAGGVSGGRGATGGGGTAGTTGGVAGTTSGAAGTTSDAAGTTGGVDAATDRLADGSISAGRHGYLLQPSDGGVSPPGAGALTLVLDGDTRTAILGSSNGGGAAPYTVTAAGVIQIRQAFNFSSSCTHVTYNSLDLTPAADGTLGVAGQGQTMTMTSDVGGPPTPFAISLVGIPDMARPFLVGVPGVTGAFASVTLAVSEPIPPGATPMLVASNGDQMPLIAPSGATAAVFSFALPSTLRRFDEPYHVSFGGIADFAGNVASAADDVTFTTGPAPPLVPADGFESATGTTLGGAQVISAPGAPTISGTRSLYVPPTTGLPGGTSWQLALRLTLSPGAQKLRFSYQSVNPTSYGGPRFLMASVDGSIVAFTPPVVTTPTTTATIPSGPQVTLGPISAAEYALPTGAHGELVITASPNGGGSCGGLPPPPTAGMIIDDLRAE